MSVRAFTNCKFCGILTYEESERVKSGQNSEVRRCREPRLRIESSSADFAPLKPFGPEHISNGIVRWFRDSILEILTCRRILYLKMYPQLIFAGRIPFPHG
jgi:hypothetical protein